MRLAYLTEYMARQEKLSAATLRKLTTKREGGERMTLTQQKGRIAFLREVFSDVVPRRKRKQTKDPDVVPTEGR